MKKKLIGLLAVLLAFVMVGTPLAANAETRTANTVTLTVGGGTASVLPRRDANCNLIPLLDIPATRDQNALVRELKNVIHATGTTFITTARFEHTHWIYGGYERGTVKTWYFGNCSFKGFDGIGSLNYYEPQETDGDVYNDIPYYEFLFTIDPHSTIRLSDGCLHYCDDVFESRLHGIVSRMEGCHDYNGSYEFFGPNGEDYYIEIGVYDNYATRITCDSIQYSLRYTISFEH